MSNSLNFNLKIDLYISQIILTIAIEFQVRKLSEAQMKVEPLRQKSKQFIARNLELSARFRELESATKKLDKTEGSLLSRDDNGKINKSSQSTRKLRTRISLANVSKTQSMHQVTLKIKKILQITLHFFSEFSFYIRIPNLLNFLKLVQIHSMASTFCKCKC